MAHVQPTDVVAPPTEVDILGRVMSNGAVVSRAVARSILHWKFDARDEARMNDLAARNGEGALTPAEQEELKNYAKAACLLGILHSKARQALKQAPKQ